MKVEFYSDQYLDGGFTWDLNLLEALVGDKLGEVEFLGDDRRFRGHSNPLP